METALKDLLQLLPFTVEGRGAPQGIVGMKNIDRYRRAATTGIEGLAADPFHPALNYLTAEAFDFFAGEHVSKVYFDRFLALRGIRTYDYVTYGKRQLDRMETRALFVVARWEPPDTAR